MRMKTKLIFLIQFKPMKLDLSHSTSRKGWKRDSWRERGVLKWAMMALLNYFSSVLISGYTGYCVGSMFLTSVHVVGQWVSHGFSVTQSIKTLKESFCPFNILFGIYWNFGNLISKSAKHRKRKLGDNRSYMLYANCDSNAAKLSFIWMRDSLAAFKCQFDFKLTSQEVMWRGWP